MYIDIRDISMKKLKKEESKTREKTPDEREMGTGSPFTHLHTYIYTDAMACSPRWRFCLKVPCANRLCSTKECSMYEIYTIVSLEPYIFQSRINHGIVRVINFFFPFLFFSLY